jgi:hypothetical protein
MALKDLAPDASQNLGNCLIKDLCVPKVILRIGALGKLGRFESTVKFFLFILLQWEGVTVPVQAKIKKL